MAIKDEEIKRVGHLARIEINDDELPTLSKELNAILQLIETLAEFNTVDIAPMSHPLDLNQRFRSDEVTETNNRECFQSIAPNVEQGLYLVPPVLE